MRGDERAQPAVEHLVGERGRAAVEAQLGAVADPAQPGPQARLARPAAERDGCSTSRSRWGPSNTSARDTALPPRTVGRATGTRSSHGEAGRMHEARLPGAAAARVTTSRPSSTSRVGPGSTASSCGPRATATSRGRLPELRAAARAGVVMQTVCPETDHFIGDFDADQRRDAIEQLRTQLSVIAELGGEGVLTPASWGMFSLRLPPFTPPRTAGGRPQGAARGADPARRARGARRASGSRSRRSTATRTT